MTLRRRKHTERAAGSALPSLSDRELLILTALQGSLREGLYGIEIRDAAAEHGDRIPFGSLYVTLSRLLAKGFVQRTEGEAYAGDPEAHRQYYRITARGAQAAMQKAALIAGALGRVTWAGVR